MKIKMVLVFLAACSVVRAQTITHQPVSPNSVTRVATALNHISLIEMPEPITNAAMGSEDFRIEWHGNTVALKPLRQGQSTNLFIWTEHGQSSYEILAPGEVSTAAFVLDQTEGRPLAAKQAENPVRADDTEIQKLADMLIAQTMLQSAPVNSRGVKNAKDHVNVRISDIVRDKDSLYVRYVVSNPGQHSYRLSDPAVLSVVPATPVVVLSALKGTQLSSQRLTEFGPGSMTAVPVRETRLSSRDVNPGQSVEGVLCFKPTEDKPQIYRFVFANDLNHQVDAAAVL